MSVGQRIASAATLAVGLELWSGAALIPWSTHSRSLLRHRDHVVHRDEYEFGFWLAIGLHVAMVVFVWCVVLSERPAGFIQRID